MKNRKLRSTISLILAITMLLTGSMLAYAVDLSGLFADSAVTELKLDEDCQILRYVDADALRASKHVARLKNQEQMDTYVFQNRDGTRTVYFMGGPVKYRDENGIIREKDLTLVQKSGGYGVVSSDTDMLLPASAEDGIEVAHSGLTITINPEKVSFAAKTGVVDGEAYRYADCFGSGIDLVYTPVLTGLKEDIVMERYFGKRQFSFLVETYGLNLYQRDGQYYFAGGENSDDKLWLGELVIYDAMGKPGTGTMTVEAVEERQQYRVTLTVDEAFLKSAETVFPVTVDPTISLTESGATEYEDIEDATVFSNKLNLNTGTWTYNTVGYEDSNYGVGKTLYRLTCLQNHAGYSAASADDITSVLVYIKEGSGSAEQRIRLYAANSPWTESTVTQGNYGGYDTTTCYDWDDMGYGSWGEFDITDLAKEWKDGTRNMNCGFILVNENETDESADKSLYSSEYSTANKRPYVVATFTGPIALDQTSAEVNEGSTVQLTLSEGTAVSWSSSNTSVATVSSSGVVTGVRAGSALITVRDASGNAANCSITVKLPETNYRFSNNSLIRVMSTRRTGDATGSNIKGYTLTNAVPEIYGQIWVVDRLESGYYTLAPSYKPTYFLALDSGSDLVLQQSCTNAAQWKIYYSSSGYVFQNRYTGNYLRMSTINYDVEISTTVTTQGRWTLETPSIPSGIVLYDPQTCAWADTSGTAYLNYGTGLQAMCMPVGQDTGNFTMTVNGTNSSVLSCTAAGVITASKCGEYTDVKVKHACNEETAVFTLRAILPLSGSELPYEPEIWNDPSDNNYEESPRDLLLQQIQGSTNCYMYALNLQFNPADGNLPSYSVAPGNFSGDFTIHESGVFNVCTTATLTNIRSKIQLDAELLDYSIQEVGRNERCESGTYKVAVVCTTDHSSFHWFRQNPDGTWSQKMSSEEVTNLDSESNSIWDPESVDIPGNTYETTFAYFSVTSSAEYLQILPND